MSGNDDTQFWGDKVTGGIQQPVGYQLAETQVVPVASQPIDVTNVASVTGTLTSVFSFTVPYDMFITNISILPLTSTAILSFFIQYGGYLIGNSNNLLQMTNAAFSRDFDPFHPPLLHAGDIINVSASSNVNQSISITVSGFTKTS